jgi:iron complex outermembrane receptor protein
MSRFLLASALLLAARAASAQTPAPTPRATTAVSLSGRVLDQSTQQPLPGATVFFPDLKQSTATDADGRFSFQNLPRGRFLVQVRSLGYGTLVRTVDTGAGPLADLSLAPAVTELGQVVVTGVSASTELRRSPVPTTVVDREELNRRASTNVIDAIARTPGVNQITTGAAISKPVIRGLSSNRVITLNNGAKQEGQQWGDEHGIEIDEYSIDRAEIIKGPGSLLYGSDGMAGVVNFVAPDPVDNGRVVGSVTANYQTNNRLQGYSLMNAGNLNGFNWMVRGSGKVAGDYRNRYDGRVYNSGFRELNGSGYLGLNKSWGYSHLTFSSFNQELGLIEGARDSVSGLFTREELGRGGAYSVLVDPGEFRGYELDVPRQQINHLRIGTDNNFILGTSRLTLNLGWQQNLRREFGEVTAPNEPSLYFQLRTFDYAARYFLPELGGWNTTVGVSGMRQENQNLGEEFLIPAYRLFDGGVFGVSKRTFGRLDLSGGLRYDQRRLTADALWLGADEQPVAIGTPGAEQKFGAFQNTYRNWSGSLGGAFSVTDDLVLKANLSRGFRAPNIAELGSNGVHEGTTRYEIGNPKLKAETSLQSDLGLSLNTEHVTFSLDGFDNRIQNFIFPRRIANAAGGDSTRVNPEDGEEYRVFVYGQSQANLYGGELTVDLHPHPLDWLHFENSFSMVRSRRLGQAEGEKWLPFTPADRLQSELRVSFRKVPGLNRVANVYARVGLEHNFAQRRIFGAFDTETPTSAYTLINLGAGTDLTNGKGRTLASLLVSVNNLFDVAYQNHLSRLKYTDVNYLTGRMGVFNMGRNVSVKLLVPLSFK